MSEKYAEVKRLNVHDRNRAKNTAKQQIISKIGNRPKKEDFKRATGDTSKLIRQVGVYVVLLVILVVAFILSAQKQFIAANDLFSPYGDTAESSKYLLLFFGEICAVFFMAIPSSLPAHIITITPEKDKKPAKTVNLTTLFCYGFAVACASIAIVANVTVTMDKWEKLNKVALLAIIEMFVPPFTSLFGGWVFERLAKKWSDYTDDINRKFYIADENWLKWHDDPTQHPEYNLCLQNSIIAELYKYEGNKELLEADRELRRIAYSVEKYEMSDVLETVDVSSFLSNPTPQQ